MLDLDIHNSKNIHTINSICICHIKYIINHILKDFKAHKRHCSVIICDDLFIQDINKQYRNKDCPTDVISFAFDDTDEEFILPSSSLGEIIISAETAWNQAKEFTVSYEEELFRLVIHGTLHLLGFDHELSELDHQKMFALQDKYMDHFMKKFYGQDSLHI